MINRLFLWLALTCLSASEIYANGCMPPRPEHGVSKWADTIYKHAESIAVVRVVAVSTKQQLGTVAVTVAVVEALKGVVPQEVTFGKNRLVNGPELHAGETRLLALNGKHVAPCLSKMFSFSQEAVVAELRIIRDHGSQRAL